MLHQKFFSTKELVRLAKLPQEVLCLKERKSVIENKGCNTHPFIVLFNSNLLKMEKYRNASGESGVFAFEVGADSIKVQFIDGAIYLYSYSSAGSLNIEHMKNLARLGVGLNSFINKTVRKNYAAKLR